jgi:hypothetical protein
LSPISGIMAPKETKRDRERRLKAQEQEATNAATDGPTDDDPEVPIQYDTEGVVMRPGTSSAAAAASTALGASAATAVAKVGSLSLSSDPESDGVAREKERSAIPAKRALARSARSRSKVPKKKAKKSKKEPRRRKESSSLSSSSERDGNRHRGGRGRSPSTTVSSSSSGSGDSDWEEFFANNTVVKVRHMLKTAPPHAPRDVAKGRFSFDALGEVQFVKKAEKKGRKEKWMRELFSRPDTVWEIAQTVGKIHRQSGSLFSRLENSTDSRENTQTVLKLF